LGQMARQRFAEVSAAYAAFDRALALDGRNANFYADAAMAAVGVYDWEQGKKYAGRGAELFPRFAPLWAHLGYIALQEGENARAVELLRKAAQGEWYDRTGERALALANLGSACLKVQDFAASAEASCQALALAPGMAEVRYQLGAALERLGRREEAAAA